MSHGLIASCPPQILERSIKLLFETRDISQVKQFVQRQCVKVLDGRASMQDLTFAKEYRGTGSYRPGSCVPALELTRCVCVYRLSLIIYRKAGRQTSHHSKTKNGLVNGFVFI